MKNEMKAIIVLGTLIVLVSNLIAGCGKNKEEKEKAEQNRSGNSSTATEETAEKSKEGSNSGSTVNKETITPEKEISTSKIVFANGRFQIAGFAVALSSVHRQENRTDLHFAITKVKNTDLEIEPIGVTLTDDHNNHYRGALEITPYTGFPLHLLPVDFTYVKTASIVMPKPAPIETIQVGDTKHILFKKLRLVKPQFKSDFGTALLQPGKPTYVGKLLLFTIDGIVPDLYTWSVAATIENKDYNELRIGILCAVQFTDGNIAPPTKPEILVVPGLSKKTTRLRLASLQGIQIPKVRTLLISYHEWRSNQTILKLWTMSDKDFPPRVGQGTNEDIFIEAYRRNGSRNTMGDPVGLPHWYAGGTTPKDGHDLFIQEFPSVSKFGKSVIIWDKQNHASRAYVLHGHILDKYFNVAGPYYSCKTQEGAILGAPTSDVKSAKSIFATEGSYATFQNGMIVLQAKRTTITTGGLYGKWKQKGGLARNQLGFPISDEKVVTSGAQGFETTGCVQRFEGGSIYYITKGEQANQAFGIYGTIAKVYSDMQAEESWLGFPVSECYSSPETGYGQCDFEAGYIATSDRKTFHALRYEQGAIAFVSDRDGNKEIYVTDAGGRKQTNISRNPSNDWAPAWSPDGTRILFVSDRQPSGIYLMSSDGSEQRFITAGDQPEWFPDGERIIFSKPDPREKDLVGTGVVTLKRLFTAEIDDTNIRQVSPERRTAQIRDFEYFIDKHLVAPAVSPNGLRIAFANGQREAGHGYGVYLMNTDGTELESLRDRWGKNLPYWETWGIRGGTNPSWSPDGMKIAFKTDTGGSGDAVYIFNLETSMKPTQVSKIVAYGKLDWAPVDSAIVFSGYRPGYQPGYTYEGTFEIYIVCPVLKVVRKITEGQGNNYDPSWIAGKQEKTKTVSKKQAIPSKEEKVPKLERFGKQELVAALEDLRRAIIKKIQLEVDVTAQCFTSVKEYRRAKLLSDVLRPVLRVLQGTLSVLSKIGDTSTLSGQVKTSLDNAQYVSEAASLFFMVNGLRESGEKLYYAIDDTAGYVRTVKYMLQAADQTTVVRMNPRAYKQVIKQYLDSEQGTPLVIVRTSELAPDKKPAKGALVLYKTIREEFRTLIDQIQRSELPPDFPINDVVAEIDQLKHQIVEAGVHNIDVHYSIYHQGRKVHQSRKLGAVAEHNKAFAQVAGALAKRLDIEIYAECAQLAATGADAAYIVTYKVPGAGEAVKMTQQVSLLPQIVIEGKKMFTVDPEEQFYQMPQELLFSLAIEFSSLLRIADDTVLSLTKLLEETSSQVPPSEVQPTPTSTKQKEPAKQIEKQVEEAVKSLFQELLRKKR